MNREAERIIGLYERHAHEWIGDRYAQTKFIEKVWLDRFAALIASGGSILDLGCGPGKPLAAYLLAQGFEVYGIDSSPTMIAHARANFPNSNWTVGDMRHLVLGRRFAGLIAWDSFFHLSFDDQRRMFQVFQAHAAPRGPLMFTSGPRHGEAIGSFRGEPLYHASLAPEEYRELLAAHGFSVIAEKIGDADCSGHSVWLARKTEDR